MSDDVYPAEREGYVPNVVNTWSALVHGGELIIPYGLADHVTGFPTVSLAEVLRRWSECSQ